MNDSHDGTAAASPAAPQESEALHSSAVSWEGPLLGGDGRGAVRLDSGAAASAMALTWESRSELPGGRTSPEELISAGLASCFSMMLAHLLAQDGHPATRIDTQARATKRLGGNFAIKAIALHVRGEVEGIDEEAFRATASIARRDCPAANALSGTEITVEAELV
jgi:osmotically inducible protein OsmC